jgi:hypothetical protein
MIGNKMDALLADKAYDADAVREALEEIEVEAVVPSKSNRKQPRAFDREATSAAISSSTCSTS